MLSSLPEPLLGLLCKDMHTQPVCFSEGAAVMSIVMHLETLKVGGEGIMLCAHLLWLRKHVIKACLEYMSSSVEHYSK